MAVSFLFLSLGSLGIIARGTIGIGIGIGLAFRPTPGAAGVPLSAYLLSDSHPAVQEMNAPKPPPKTSTKKDVGEKDKDQQEKEPEKWRVDHVQAFEAASLPWPPVFDADLEQKTCQLSRRGQEVVWYTEKVSGKTDEIQCLDVNMSIYYGRETEKVLPCLVSTGTVWIRGQVAGTSNQNRMGCVGLFRCRSYH